MGGKKEMRGIDRWMRRMKCGINWRSRIWRKMKKGI
jgi:hypothetical protein